MNVIKTLAIAIAIASTTVSLQHQATASECGLSCCIAAGVDGVGSNTGLSISLQIDSMLMETNKQGTSEISPTQIIEEKLAIGGMMYAASTKMTMDKIAANFSYRIDENNAFVLTVPYIVNNMDMLKKVAGDTSFTKSSMDTIRGIGDSSLLYIRDVYKDTDFRTRQRLSMGIGLKAPTGASEARKANGDLIHMMMQAGSNTWDALATINGTMGFGEHEDGGALWLVSPSLFYQINSRNALGYKVGNRLNYDISTRYRMSSTFNIKLDVNGIKSASDSTDGTVDSTSGKVAYQNPSNVLDNVANTGIHSRFISPGFQWLLGDGYNLSGEYRIPVYQNTTGTQQVTDRWMFLRLGKSF